MGGPPCIAKEAVVKESLFHKLVIAPLHRQNVRINNVSQPNSTGKHLTALLKVLSSSSGLTSVDATNTCTSQSDLQNVKSSSSSLSDLDSNMSMIPAIMETSNLQQKFGGTGLLKLSKPWKQVGGWNNYAS